MEDMLWITPMQPMYKQIPSMVITFKSTYQTDFHNRLWRLHHTKVLTSLSNGSRFPSNLKDRGSLFLVLASGFVTLLAWTGWVHGLSWIGLAAPTTQWLRATVSIVLAILDVRRWSMVGLTVKLWDEDC
ncbi:hypothetical protein TIFTF001_042540 [Ficus carica]|uniref:Uncharacterized protein n=1 Tax=Ficus carica TaxID=3494 RepID=A0AA87ZNY1_FICCA|nr:hypothetical protein TIFTF001_042540 [Ficus carica]